VTTTSTAIQPSAKRVNIQRHGAQAKPYQVRQVLELVERYGLELEERE
jgi:hypothetical protein